MTNQKGFTLIELLIVISIIGILAVFAMVSFGSAQARTRDSQRKNDVNQIQKTLQMFYNDHQYYPRPPFGGAGEDCSDRPSWYVAGGNGGNGLHDQLVTAGYIKKVPQDPKNSYVVPVQNGLFYLYCYGAPADGSSYTLYANFENKSDPQITNPGEFWLYVKTNP